MAGVKVKIGANTEELEKAVKKAKKQVGELGSEFREGASAAAKWGAAMAAAGVAAGAAITNNSIQAARELDNLSKVANTSRKTFQEWAVGARTVGVEQDKLADILKDVNDRIGDFSATGGGPMADFFEKIAPRVGVTAENFRKLSGPDALQLYVDSLEKANLSQQDMTFYMEAMASDATALLPLLKDGGAAMSEQARQAERLGLVMSDIDSEQLLMAQQSMQEAAEIAKSFANQMAVELAPIIQAVTRLFTEQAEEAGGVGEVASTAFNNIISAASFGVDAVEGVRRTFEVAGKGVALFGLGVVDVMLTAADAIVNNPIRAINELIEALNKIPGVDIDQVSLSGFGQGIAEELETVRKAQEIGIQDIKDTILAPLPGMKFEQFVAESKANAEAAAEEMVAVSSMLRPDLGGEGRDGEGGETSETDAEKLREQLAKRLEVIRESNLTERELTLEKYAQQNEDLAAALEQELLTKEEWAEQSRMLKAREEADLTAIEEKASDERKKLADEEQKRKLQGFKSMFGDLSTLMNSESRKMFEIGKAASLAQAVVDGYAAITGAYKVGASIGGPALGAAFGAAAGAATFQQVQAIRNASFGSGGGSGGAGGAGGGSVTQNINAQGEAVTGQVEQRQTLTVQGIDPNQMFSGRQLVDIINQAQKDGALLQVDQ